MANKQINQLTAAPQALADTDVAAIEQDVSSVWTTGKITLLALYTWIVGKLNTAGRIIPAGGTTDQLLGKTSGTDYAVSWRTVRGMPEPDGGGADDELFLRYDGGGTWSYQLVPPAGTDGQIQWNDSGVRAGAAKAEIDANGTLRLVVDATPATPAAGKLTHHAAYLGALERPAWVNSEAKAHLAQDLLAAKRFVSTTALVGNASRLHVGIADSTEGTAGAVTPTFSDLPNSLVKTHVTSAATAGSNASLRYGALYLARGNAAGAGGFRVRFLWHPNDAATVADARCFVGLIGQTGAIGNVNPSTLTNIIGVGADNGETNLSLMHNDGSGTAAKTSLGASFPQSDTSKVYELILEAEPNASKVHYQVRELGSGAVARGSITTELPAGDQGLTHHFFRNNGATAAAVRFGFGYVYAERDL